MSMRGHRVVVLVKSTLTTFPYKTDVEIPYNASAEKQTAIGSLSKRSKQ